MLKFQWNIVGSTIMHSSVVYIGLLVVQRNSSLIAVLRVCNVQRIFDAIFVCSIAPKHFHRYAFAVTFTLSSDFAPKHLSNRNSLLPCDDINNKFKHMFDWLILLDFVIICKLIQYHSILFWHGYWINRMNSIVNIRMERKTN